MSKVTEASCGIKNMSAFLDMLGVSEGTVTSPITRCDGYDVIVTGVDGKPEVFTDFSTHPFAGRKSKAINSKGLTSNASGRYQFMLKDYAHYKKQLGLIDFGPMSQDLWAIQLIRERRGAIDDIRAGRIEAAIAKVNNLWASLPGAGYGQPEHRIDKLLAAYTVAGGTLAKG